MEGENKFTHGAQVESKLDAFYQSVPEGMEILESVRKGFVRFGNDLKELHLDFDVNESRLHSTDDLEVQMFLASMSSSDPKEREEKAYLTCAIHWLDDFFDEPELAAQFAKDMISSRHDILEILTVMGSIGEVGIRMINVANKKEAAEKGIHRVFYGGLVQRSESSDDRKKYTAEYQDIGLRSIDQAFAEEIKNLKPEAYWVTNKVVMELINSPEENMDLNVSEVWNLIFAPAIYYHDIAEEEQRGVAGYTEEEKPSVKDMQDVVALGAKYLPLFDDELRPLKIQQLKAVTDSFKKVLPPEIVEEYEKIINL